MNRITISKVTELPLVTEPNTMYLLRSGVGGSDYMEMYFSTNDGATVVPGITDSHVRRTIEGYSNTELFKELYIVTDITERDALTLTHDAMVYVLDSQGDGSGSIGETLYFFSFVQQGFRKLVSANPVVNWSQILGAPKSTADEIDQAVAAKHSHTNQDVLDKLGVNSQGQLTYDGALTFNVVFVDPQW